MEADDNQVLRRSKEIYNKICLGEYGLREGSSKSRVWTVFAKIVDQNGVEISGHVCCLMCKKVFIFSKTSYTSNLVKHRCYAIKYIHKPKSSTVDVELPKLEFSNISLESSDDNNLTHLITKCLIKNCVSYDLIQDQDFRAVFQEFLALGDKFGIIDVGKLLPSAKAVARNVNEIYENCYDRIKAEIASNRENGFGIAINIRTNNFLKLSYVALTIHFIKSGAVTCRLLGLRTIEGENCTGQIIFETVDSILKDYDCKLSSTSLMVTNGCDEIIKSQTVTCITHLLNNALQKSVEGVPKVAELIRCCLKLINFLKRQETPIFRESLENVCFCPSRWITVYKMLSEIAILWPKIDNILRDEDEKVLKQNINVNHLRAVIKVLEPFEEAIETLEKDGKATLHLVMVYLHDLKKSCDINENEFEDFDFIRILRKNIRLNLEKIVSENLTILHKLALFLYPPAKKLLQFNDEEKKCIETECKRLMKCFENNLKPNIKQEPNCSPSPVSKRRKLFSDFVDSAVDNDDPNEFIIQELEVYKLTRVINSDDFDVFSWWEQQKDNLPLLYKLSHTVLATPASSASAQRVFISSGNLFSDKISELGASDVNVEQMAFLKFNAEPDELDFQIQNEYI